MTSKKIFYAGNHFTPKQTENKNLCKQRISGSILWRKAGVGGFLVETLFKARSCKLGWFFFNMNPPVTVFNPLRSRWMFDETVWCVPVRYVTCTRRGFSLSTLAHVSHSLLFRFRKVSIWHLEGRLLLGGLLEKARFGGFFFLSGACIFGFSVCLLFVYSYLDSQSTNLVVALS